MFSVEFGLMALQLLFYSILILSLQIDAYLVLKILLVSFLDTFILKS